MTASRPSVRIKAGPHARIDVRQREARTEDRDGEAVLRPEQKNGRLTPVVVLAQPGLDPDAVLVDEDDLPEGGIAR